MTEIKGTKPASTSQSDLLGTQMFLVYDGMGNCHEHHDTLEEAVEYAETLVGEYQDNAEDGWPGDGDIDVLQVVRRWSLLPVSPPPGEDPETPWADLLPVELPQVPVFTPEQIEASIKAVLTNGYPLVDSDGTESGTVSWTEVMSARIATLVIHHLQKSRR